MSDLKTLSAEMEKLKKQIENIIHISGYHHYDDLSRLDDYKQITDSDGRQILEEYERIISDLDKTARRLAYYKKPVKEVSCIYRNESGRYETDSGHYYTSGRTIEFLRTEETYNYNTDEWEDAKIWTTSSVEHNGKKYYIVGYPNVKMSGLKVRVRE